MSYYFQDIERLQAGFETPNHFGAVLLVCIFGLSAVAYLRRFAIGKWSEGARLSVVRKGILYLLAYGAIVMLALTYSRGAYVSFVLASAVFMTFGGMRKRALLSLAFFAVVLFAIPGGAERTVGISAIETDHSIGNRLLLWKRTCSLVADNWLSGVGRDRFMQEYIAWYNGEDSTTYYKSAVNDCLTVAAYWGLPVLFVVGAALFCAIVGCFNVAFKAGSESLLSLTTGVCAFVLAGCFSTLFIHVEVAIWFYALLAVSVAYAIVLANKKRVSFFGAKRLLVAVSGSFLLCLGVVSTGGYLSGGASFTGSTVEVYEGLGVGHYVARPKDRADRGTVLFLSDDQKAFRVANYTLRRIAKEGFVAVAPMMDRFGVMEIEPLKALLAEMKNRYCEEGGPLFVIGRGSGGRLALAVARAQSDKAIDGVGVLSIECEFPFFELSPSANIAHVDCPVAIFHSREDLEVDFSNARSLFDVARTEQVEALLKEINGPHLYNGEEWEGVLRLVLGTLQEFDDGVGA